MDVVRLRKATDWVTTSSHGDLVVELPGIKTRLLIGFPLSLKFLDDLEKVLLIDPFQQDERGKEMGTDFNLD